MILVNPLNGKQITVADKELVDRYKAAGFQEVKKPSKKK